MKWRRITINTRTEAVDLLCDRLTEIGIEGIEIIDNVPLTDDEINQMFVDIPLINGEDDGTAKVNCYIEFTDDLETIINEIQISLNELSAFIDVGVASIEITETEDKDWINNWKEFFKPFRIDDSIVIKPSWEKYELLNEDDIIIEIDPGISFGTGSHETTKLCILSLKKYLRKSDIILDAGSGSGILSIISKKLGAKEVIGIDIDINATNSAIENAQLNNLEITDENLIFETANIIKDDKTRRELGENKFDIVVANILADVIILLSSVITYNLKKDGLFICSGIIDSKEEEVKQSLINNNFEILETNRMGEWVSFVARNN
ncbi:MAG TPA: 50S ribosomal protein L11 methyltransferase [Clostridiales bacterium]|nr:50S ribosomal protein L11 methyltransferase [Clostridiales bacterium]